MEYKDPGRYIPIVYLLYSWGSHLGFSVESLYNLEYEVEGPKWEALPGAGYDRTQATCTTKNLGRMSVLNYL